ncbi:MAG: L-threonylcarbamoyladenylate synthase [Candidatus Promineifilaceae bacterium]|nr:L-threonylcarbamoyladenylate synthase [Candidatus Promineifilaceae bacterium]
MQADQSKAIEQAAALLRQGELIAYPTDTLYGVGAAAFDEQAVRRLFAAKRRPLSKGIPILLADAADLETVVSHVSAAAQRLIDRHWPGPLTLILPRRPELPPSLAPGDTVAVRVPDHDLARKFIAAAGGAVATSSANRSGEPAALDAQQALAALGDVVAAVLDGGPVQHGQASTIVDCTTTPLRILRPGPLPADAVLAQEAGSA